MHLAPTRVSPFLLLIALFFSAAMVGCDSARQAVRFHAADVTGVPYGKDFRLQAVDGGERTLADFRGKVVLLFFGFVQCPDVCPTALTRAVEIKRLLGSDGERFQPIFVTVDPERDTAAILREYMRAFDPGFVALYATPDVTRKTADEFRVHYAKVPTGSSYTMDHTAASYLFDPAGRLRLVASHSASAADVADDVRLLLRER
ncbi:MAG: SCO family protein [Burkholderiales bacterium]|nr:SCO family protein [Burkholderiales bacterium]